MHAVLDGTATSEEATALEAVLARDADAAAEFESWKVMFTAIDELPMAHPPEGLVAAIEKNLSADGQLSYRESVFISGPTRTPRFPNGLRTLFRRPNRSDSTQGHGHMNANRKIWAGGAIAVVALGVVVFATGYPPKPENVTGTVVPAERYRATQSGAEAIKLGDPSTGKPTGAPTDAAGIQAAKTDAGLTADRSPKNSADNAANLTSDRSPKSSADRGVMSLTAERSPKNSADNAANLAADRSPKNSANNAANLAADRSPKNSADNSANLAADRTPRNSADRAPSLQAERTGAQNKADKAPSN